MHELISFGEITLDTIGSSGTPAVEGSAAILDSLGTCYGGRGANAATFFALWWPGTALVSAAGEDFVQAGHRDRLERHGVDCSEVLIEANRPTPRALVFHIGDIGGVSQTFFHCAADPAADAVYREHVHRVAATSQSRFLYCTSGRQDLNLHLLTHLPCDLKAYAPGPQIFHYPRTELEPFLREVDVLFLNRPEADYLRRTLNMDSAQINRAFRLAFHVVTRGADGCSVHEGRRHTNLPACRPDALVDPTGAGDAFAGTFLAEYLQTGDARAAAQLGLVVSSFVVERVGCQENVPGPEQARERLREYAQGQRSTA
jgi:ribokinase